MAIVGVILGLLSAAIFWLIRLNMAADAAKGLTDTAQDVQGIFRRRKWRKKLAVDLLTEVQDPRMAATVMMVALAQSDGAITAAENTVIQRHVTGKLGATAAQSEDLIAHGRWLVRDVIDPDNTFRRLIPVIQKSCTPEEVDDLISMLEAVASANGKPGEIEEQAIDRLKRGLGRR